MILIYGKSGSGKDTIAKEISKYGYKPVVLYTTRPKRDNEINGIDYYFVNNDVFKQYSKNNLFLWETQYNTTFGIWKYACPKKIDMESVMVVNPTSLQYMKFAKWAHPVCFYLKADTTEIRKRLLNRGDNPDEIDRRIRSDNEDFENVLHLADYVIDNNGDRTISDIAQKIIKIYEVLKEK